MTAVAVATSFIICRRAKVALDAADAHFDLWIRLLFLGFLPHFVFGHAELCGIAVALPGEIDHADRQKQRARAPEQRFERCGHAQDSGLGAHPGQRQKLVQVAGDFVVNHQADQRKQDQSLQERGKILSRQALDLREEIQPLDVGRQLGRRDSEAGGRQLRESHHQNQRRAAGEQRSQNRQEEFVDQGDQGLRREIGGEGAREQLASDAQNPQKPDSAGAHDQRQKGEELNRGDELLTGRELPLAPGALQALLGGFFCTLAAG